MSMWISRSGLGVKRLWGAMKGATNRMSWRWEGLDIWGLAIIILHGTLHKLLNYLVTILVTPK